MYRTYLLNNLGSFKLSNSVVIVDIGFAMSSFIKIHFLFLAALFVVISSVTSNNAYLYTPFPGSILPGGCLFY